MLGALRFFHENELITPYVCVPGVWQKGRASTYVPGKKPEKAIQGHLKVALGSWFQGQIKVLMEDATPPGRIDVRLLRSAESSKGLQYWAIIELKVIKTFRNKKVGKPNAVPIKENVDAIVDGIQQSNSYRSYVELDEGFLEVFDLRKAKDEIEKDERITAALAGSKVVCNIRPVYGTAKDARTAGVHV